MTTVQDKLDIITADADYVDKSLILKHRDTAGCVYEWLFKWDDSNAQKFKKFFGYTWDNEKTFEEQTVESEYYIRNQVATEDNIPYVRVTPKSIGLKLHLQGGEFEASANTTTKHQVKFDGNIEIVGALFKALAPHNGDTVNVKIIDVDNILGYGANTVLAQFAENVPGQLCTEVISVESSTSDLVYAGLYLSMEYTNTHASETVDVHYAYKYYQ